MIKERFNSDWYISDKQEQSLVESMAASDTAKKRINLPHDAMIQEHRDPNTKNAGQTGYYPGKVYYYTKEFFVPEEWEKQVIGFEFEGIYTNAKIYLNGDFVGGSQYGYNSLHVQANESLLYGTTNQIQVIVNNSAELNSRWYTGSGIIRDVWLLRGGLVHIPVDHVKITVPDVDEKAAMVEVDITVKNLGFDKHKVRLMTEIFAPDGTLAVKGNTPVTLYGLQEEKNHQRLLIKNPMLWDCEIPNLYTCKVSLYQEEKLTEAVEEEIGIRKIQLDPSYGFRLNGNEVKLRGTCIHEDHGIIGAVSLEAAEERKCKLLKEAGFNCIRNSHHPISKSMLRVCDRLGMLVIDELSDVWNHAKNLNDFSASFADDWEKEVTRMVDKDYNHPSVIMYSMGNEIQEAGTAKGAQLNRKIANKFRTLDSTRYLTNGINGILAAGEKFMMIVQDILQSNGIEMPDPSDSAAAESTETAESAGSDMLNGMMSIMVGPLADQIATHPLITEITEEFVEAMDIAGYNYLTGRHAFEGEHYPNRVVLGTETFPADIANLWKIVKENSHVIGDMTWTGYDYLGEAGVGIFHYDGGMNFRAQYPERTASIGDIDLIGYRKPISYYRETVYGLRDAPYIAVERMNRKGQTAGKTPWMWKDNISSWNWQGYEGQEATVDVFSDAQEVELYLNNQLIERKPAGEAQDYIATFSVPYQQGELKAVAIRDGKSEAEFSLATAGEEIELVAVPDKTQLVADGSDLCFITCHFVDDRGIANLNVKNKVTIELEGKGVLAGFGSANPSSEGNYFDTTWEPYDGYAMAVIRSTNEPGDIAVNIKAEGCKEQKIILQSN